MNGNRSVQGPRGYVPPSQQVQVSGPVTTSCDDGNLVYRKPNSITLSATGTGAAVKMQSADGVVESINGSLGATSFSVNELPDRTGLDLGGADLLGINALRYALQTYAVLVSYVNYKAGTSSQLSNPLKIYRGAIDGSVNIISRSVAADQSNMQYDASLITLTGEWLLTSNTALQMTIANTVSVSLTFKVAKLVPYIQSF